MQIIIKKIIKKIRRKKSQLKDSNPHTFDYAPWSPTLTIPPQKPFKDKSILRRHRVGSS